MNAFFCALGIIMVVVAIFTLIGCGACTFFAFSDKDWMPAAAAVVLALTTGGLAYGGVRTTTAGSRGINAQSCDSFAEQTDYTTRLIITTMWDSGACYVDFDGQWVPKDQLWAEMRSNR